MAITDLTNTTWVLNDELVSYPGGTYSMKTYSVDITTSAPVMDSYSGEEYIEFTAINIGYDSGYECNLIYLSSAVAYRAVLGGGTDTKTLPDTLNHDAVVFTITGGTDATNSALIAWLESNATEQAPPINNVVISYDGSEIASMTESGTKTLQTNGKYCADDITVVYTRPEPVLQSKHNIDPTTVPQTIVPNVGFDGLSEVQINAMPSMALPTSTSSSPVGTQKLNVSPDASDRYINIPTGYNNTYAYYKIGKTATMGLPTSLSSTSSGTRKATLYPSASESSYLNIPTGYNSSPAYYEVVMRNYSNTVPRTATVTERTITLTSIIRLPRMITFRTGTTTVLSNITSGRYIGMVISLTSTTGYIGVYYSRSTSSSVAVSSGALSTITPSSANLSYEYDSDTETFTITSTTDRFYTGMTTAIVYYQI